MSKYLLLFALIVACLTTAESQNKRSVYVSPLSKGEKTKKPKEPRSKKDYMGYKGHIEGGVGSFEIPPANSMLLISAFTSHGFYKKNLFFGPGIGFDKYDTLTVVPLALDARFIFTGSKSDDKSYTATRRGLNMFIQFSGGYARSLREITQNSRTEGLFLQTGLGFLIGKLDDVRMTLTFSYKYQELPGFSLENRHNYFSFFNVKLGAELSP